MDLPIALEREVGHRPGREDRGAGVLTETVGAGTGRGPGADADLARLVDAFSALLATEEETSASGGGQIGRGGKRCRPQRAAGGALPPSQPPTAPAHGLRAWEMCRHSTADQPGKGRQYPPGRR